MLFVGFLAIFNVTTSLLTAQHIIAPTLYLGYRAVSTGLYLVGVTTTRASLAEWLYGIAQVTPRNTRHAMYSQRLLGGSWLTACSLQLRPLCAYCISSRA